MFLVYNPRTTPTQIGTEKVVFYITVYTARIRITELKKNGGSHLYKTVRTKYGYLAYNATTNRYFDDRSVLSQQVVDLLFPS